MIDGLFELTKNSLADIGNYRELKDLGGGGSRFGAFSREVLYFGLSDW